MNEPFWTKSFKVLIDRRYIIEIFPGERTKTIESKLNAVSRFIILYFVGIAMYKKSIIPLVIGFLMLLIVIYEYNKKPSNKYNVNNVNNKFTKELKHKYTDSDIFNKPNIPSIGSIKDPVYFNRNTNSSHDDDAPKTGNCRNSTKENIFGNPNVTNIETVMDPACSMNSKDFDKSFEEHTFVENDDIFNQNSRRQFYSVVDNNQTNFVSYLNHRETN